MCVLPSLPPCLATRERSEQSPICSRSGLALDHPSPDANAQSDAQRAQRPRTSSQVNVQKHPRTWSTRHFTRAKTAPTSSAAPHPPPTTSPIRRASGSRWLPRFACVSSTRLLVPGIALPWPSSWQSIFGGGPGSSRGEEQGRGSGEGNNSFTPGGSPQCTRASQLTP
jgi:hypothetical protein